MSKVKKKAEEELLCFGDFIEDNEKCDVCPRNIDCFIKVFNKLDCFSRAVFSGKCNEAECRTDNERCSRVRWIIRNRQEKECMGKINQRSDDCLICDRMEECEVMDIVASNLGSGKFGAEKIIAEQLEEMRVSLDTCFGRFEFEEECFEGCDFALRCRRESGIIPGRSCSHWKKEVIQDLEDNMPCSIGDACLSFQTCSKILADLQSKAREEAEKMKPFKTFLKLDDIRGSLSVLEK